MSAVQTVAGPDSPGSHGAEGPGIRDECSAAPPSRRDVATALGVPTVVLAIHTATYGPWIEDDAGITFAYARSLATGAGPVLQPGADPVEGFSNPLWLAILVLGRVARAVRPRHVVRGAGPRPLPEARRPGVRDGDVRRHLRAARMVTHRPVRSPSPPAR